MTEAEVRTRVSAAKLWLTAPGVGNAPYLSTALYAMPVVVRSGVGTVSADDRWRVYVDDEWALTAEIPVLAAHLAHVVWHLLREHADRARSMDVGTNESEDWTTAADLTVSQSLRHAGHDTAGLPVPEDLEVPADRSAEEYFALLHRLAVDRESAPGEGVPGPCGSSADGLRRPYELPGEDEQEIGDVRAAELRKQVAIAFSDHMKQMGTAPGEWSRWVEEILDPKVPWQQVLQSSVRRAVGWASGNTHQTYRRLSRRQAASPRTVLPGTHRAVPAVAIVLDTSGSVDDGLLAQALGEVDGVLRALGTAVAGVDVLTCDAAVQTAGKVTSARRVQLGGGGGTDMRIGIASALALRPRPEIVVVLTDGWTPWPDSAPAGATVIAVMVAREGYPETPSWLTVVDCAA